MRQSVSRLTYSIFILTIAFFSVNAVASNFYPAGSNWNGIKSSKSWNWQVKQKQHLQKLLEEYEMHWSMGHADEVTDLYTEDAIFFAPGAAPFVGHDSIEELIQSLMSSGINEVSLTADEIEVNGRGRSAYIIGHYDLYVGGASVGQGPFFFVLKNNDKQWKIHRDIFNSSQP